jgi:hypothetical protein
MDLDDLSPRGAADHPAAADEAASAAETVPHPMDSLIDGWFARSFHNSVVSRDTETFNHVYAAKEDLKRLILENSNG